VLCLAINTKGWLP